MKILTHVDRPMHGVRKVETRELWWWGYFRWVRRTFYVLGVPVWYSESRGYNRELPITQLINKACGTGR